MCEVSGLVNLGTVGIAGALATLVHEASRLSFVIAASSLNLIKCKISEGAKFQPANVCAPYSY